MSAARPPVADQRAGSLRYLAQRVRSHAYWARTQGIGRLVEEDRLDPVDRVRAAARKLRWRVLHGVAPGMAVPVYVVGVQRSGTNMLVRGLESAPEFEVHNENDRRVFSRYQLRSDEVVARTVRHSRHAYVLFKPLCDSHRVAELLSLPGLPAGRAVWAYRDVDDRARSAVAKFGDANLRALRQISAGEGAGLWQAQRMSAETLEILRGFSYDAMTPHTAAALFWWARNRLFFELGYDQRADVLLSSYDAVIADPQAQIRALCDFLDFPYRPELSAHVEQRSGARRPLDIEPRARELCDDLAARLAGASAAATPVTTAH